ncbi:MAG TPA: hypothetical protein VHQ41_03140 [Patescibacteria group bacterium]|jgi:hypothetical protein|nr:hypothetical protein [Patescibacteria group bacterium]
MGIQGTGLHTSNPRLRFFFIVFVAIVAFGVTFYWRQQTLKQAEYVSFPDHNSRALQAELHSKNYQIDVQDASPTAK